MIDWCTPSDALVDVYLWRMASLLCREYNTLGVSLRSVVVSSGCFSVEAAATGNAACLLSRTSGEHVRYLPAAKRRRSAQSNFKVRQNFSFASKRLFLKACTIVLPVRGLQGITDFKKSALFYVLILFFYFSFFIQSHIYFSTGLTLQKTRGVLASYHQSERGASFCITSTIQHGRRSVILVGGGHLSIAKSGICYR